MIPVLFVQLLVFPFVANVMVSSWQDSRRQISLQNVADHLGSTIQQLYFYVSLEDIAPGIITQKSTLPLAIDESPFTAIGSLIVPPNPDLGRKLLLSLTMEKFRTTATSTVTLGTNVKWKESVFRSNSPDASIKVQKFANHTLLFFFG